MKWVWRGMTAMTAMAACSMPSDRDVLATVGEVEIDVSRLETLEANLSDDLLPTTVGEEAIRELLRSLVDAEIMALEAVAMGFDRDPDVTARLKSKEKEHLKELVWSREFGQVSVSDEEIEEAYHNKGWSRRVRLAHITTATEAEAWEIVKAVQGGADFVELAKEKSLAPDRQAGGDLGHYFGQADSSFEVVRVALALAEGEVSFPIKGKQGFDVVRVIEAISVPLEQVREDLEAALLQQKTALGRDDFLKQLEAELGVVYVRDGIDAMIQALGDTSAAPVTQLDTPLIRYGDGRGVSVASASRALLRRRAPLHTLRDSASVAAGLRHWLLSDTLLVARARKRGWHESDEVREFVDREFRLLLVNHLRKRQVLDRVEISEAEMEAQYEKDKHEFVVSAQITVVEILSSTEEESRNLLDLVRAGSDMSELARQHTRRGSAARSGGHLHIGIGEEEKWGPIYAAAHEGEVGVLVGPLKVDGGFSILRVEERLPERLRSLDELTPVLRHRLKQRRHLTDFEAYMAGLRETYANEVKWNDAAIEALAARRTESEARP
jgi:peptidyl-prolyl cis-trans isomerase C